MYLEPRGRTKAGSKIPGALRYDNLHIFRDEDVLFSFHCWCVVCLYNAATITHNNIHVVNGCITRESISPLRLSPCD
jgi:hypothetical protein